MCIDEALFYIENQLQNKYTVMFNGLRRRETQRRMWLNRINKMFKKQRVRCLNRSCAYELKRKNNNLPQ